MITNTFSPSKQVLEWMAQAEAYSMGRIAGLRSSVIEGLGARFGELPDGLSDAIQFTDNAARLSALLLLAVRCASLDEFRRDAQI